MVQFHNQFKVLKIYFSLLYKQLCSHAYHGRFTTSVHNNQANQRSPCNKAIKSISFQITIYNKLFLHSTIDITSMRHNLFLFFQQRNKATTIHDIYIYILEVCSWQRNRATTIHKKIDYESLKINITNTCYCQVKSFEGNSQKPNLGKP